MEETKIISSISILLYSRIYDSLFCQIYDNETKSILTKSIITGSFNTQLKISKHQNCIHFMIRKSQKDVIILNEFKLNLQDDEKMMIVQKQTDYLKVKKNFSNYSLMIQVFFKGFQRCEELQFSHQLVQLKNSFQDQQEAIKIELQLKLMAGVHLTSLLRNVCQKNFYHKRIDSSKFSNSSAQSLRSKKKIHTFSSNKFNLLTNNLKKNNYFINCSKLEEKSISKFIKNSSLKNRKFNKSLTNMVDGQQFIRRKQKKTTTFINVSQSSKQSLDQVNVQQNSQMSKQKSGCEQLFKHQIKLKTNKSIKNQEQLQKRRSKQQFQSQVEQQQHKQKQQGHKQKKKQKKVQFINDLQFNFQKLKFLCQQKPIQKISFKKIKRNTGNKTTYKPIISVNNVKQSTQAINLTTKQNAFLHQINNKQNKSFSQRRYFYQNLQKKAIKTIERQNTIVNYVKRYCLTQLKSNQDQKIVQKLKQS